MIDAHDAVEQATPRHPRSFLDPTCHGEDRHPVISVGKHEPIEEASTPGDHLREMEDADMEHMNDTTNVDVRPTRRLARLDRATRELLARVGPLLLRFTLGIVFVWFGLLKVASASAVGGLVATTVPFLDSSWFVPVLGVLEVAIGLAFATGRFLRVVLPLFVLHLGGTFLVLIVLPEVAFEGDNPLMLTLVGEFVLKNLVLLSAGLVVASGVHPAPRHSRGPDNGRHPDGDVSGKPMRERRVVVGMLTMAIVALLASSCASEDSGPSAAADVSTIAVRDYEFEPGTASVEVGEAVTWVWEGQAQHDVVGDGFESPAQSTGSFRHAFDQPGTYPFACTLHPGMAGEVLVEQGAG